MFSLKNMPVDHMSENQQLAVKELGRYVRIISVFNVGVFSADAPVKVYFSDHYNYMTDTFKC